VEQALRESQMSVPPSTMAPSIDAQGPTSSFSAGQDASGSCDWRSLPSLPPSPSCQRSRQTRVASLGEVASKDDQARLAARKLLVGSSVDNPFPSAKEAGQGGLQRSSLSTGSMNRLCHKQAQSMNYRLRSCVVEARRNANELVERRKVISDIHPPDGDAIDTSNLHFLAGLSFDRTVTQARASSSSSTLRASTAASTYALEPLERIARTSPPPHLLPGTSGGMLARLRACESRAHHNKEVVSYHRQFLSSYAAMRGSEHRPGTVP